MYDMCMLTAYWDLTCGPFVVFFTKFFAGSMVACICWWWGTV